jgi:uroporphyrinogen decarboxylase
MEHNFPFIRACWRKKTEYTPVWLMRQAGRYMKEYREIRSKVSFLTMCKTPDLAATITLQPVKKLGVDAAIIFADILLPLEAMGIDLDFTLDRGPVIHNPVKNRSNILKLHAIEPQEDLPFVLEAIKIVRRELNSRIPLIGFSGAPFTLASYLIEGGRSQNYIATKSLMYQDPSSWHHLMEILTQVVIRYLNSQIEAGAQAVQFFDSWVGCLSPRDYEEFVLPYSREAIRQLKKDIPVIHFAVNSASLLKLIKKAGGNVIGIDWRINLKDAWQKIGYDVAIQGNLDPVILFAPSDKIELRVKEILESAENRAGHIFNLGHGILPQTPVENVIAMVEVAHNLSKRNK